MTVGIVVALSPVQTDISTAVQQPRCILAIVPLGQTGLPLGTTKSCMTSFEMPHWGR